jgi:hypothetical protein
LPCFTLSPYRRPAKRYKDPEVAAMEPT